MSGSAKGAAKTRRLLELYLYLCAVPVPVTRDRIRSQISGYAALSDEAFSRQFERDKDDLRSVGVDVEVTGEAGSDVGSRYRVLPSRTALPGLEFTPEEIAALQVARGLWEHVDMAAPTSGAVRKLVRRRIEIEDTPLAGLVPRAAGTGPVFEALRRAVTTRTPVTFSYHAARATDVSERVVEPWQLVLRHGAAYLRGWDRGRGEPRVFRLNRVVGEVRPAGEAGAYAMPSADSLGPLFPSHEGSSPVSVRVAVAPGRGAHLRALATDTGPAAVPGEGWETMTLAVTDIRALTDAVLALGADAIVLEPEHLRNHVREHLRAMVMGRS